MDRLSSCYFCGAALDVSLSEYPVVPNELQSADDEGPTVVLCSTCRRKLGSIVETVVAAGTAEVDGDVLAAGADTEPPSPPTTAGGTTATATSDDGTVSADLGEETSTDGPTLTKLEYNKVMRLLQNRPFPIDRGEIREVATSAYDIDPGEFDAVVEAAVERDLIAVENGQFVEPT